VLGRTRSGKPVIGRRYGLRYGRPARWYHSEPGGIIVDVAMTLRLTDELQDALRETAEREHRSMQDVARTAIAEYTSKRAAMREELLESITAERAELLDRLATA